MDATSLYRAVDAQLCQGDILERVPHIILKEQPRPLRKATLSKKRMGYEVDELPEGALPTTPGEGTLVPATCRREKDHWWRPTLIFDAFAPSRPSGRIR
jgi:hypothetical protein